MPSFHDTFTKVGEFLEQTNHIWIKVVFIGGIFYGGFWCGQKYENIHLQNSFLNESKNIIIERQQKEFEYQQQILHLEANIQEQNIIIRGYEDKKR